MRSNDGFTIRPSATRVVLHPKSRKGIYHQFGVLQQHRIDRVLDKTGRACIHLPVGKTGESLYKVQPMEAVERQLGMPPSAADLLKELMDDEPDFTVVPMSQIVAGELILPDTSGDDSEPSSLPPRAWTLFPNSVNGAPFV
jgi:hypothetical protein